MKAPTNPANETERLASLRESGLLEAENRQAYDRLTRLAKRLFNVPVAMVNLIDERAQIELSVDGPGPYTLPRHVSVCAHTILSHEPLVVADTHNDMRFVDNPLVTTQPGIRFYAGIPLRLPDGATVGSLCVVDHTPREFSAADIAALSDLAALAEDEFAATSAATTDELTGLFNRRGFNQFAAFALSGARRRAEPLTLAWIDLDRFKQINDRYGHEEGDAALKAMASLLRSSFREADLLVRYGGDEFAVLFADTDENGAWIAMQYLTEQVALFNQQGNRPWTLTFSWGVCEFDHDHNDLQHWLRIADEKMFTMKQKNSVAR